jgi:hypothetical protein
MDDHIVGCLGVAVKMEAAQAEGVMLAEDLDPVAEDVTAQCCIGDLKRRLAIEGDPAEGGKV